MSHLIARFRVFSSLALRHTNGINYRIIFNNVESCTLASRN